MKAMILAAGHGERMRPLTDHTPKPLLQVGGKPLIVWHIERLAAAGLRDLVINTAHLGAQLEQALAPDSPWLRGLSVRIAWSREPEGALETAGGIAHALPLLGMAPFLVVNGDTWCDFDFGTVRDLSAWLAQRGTLAHLWLAPNPPHHPAGDFGLEHDRVTNDATYKLTFTGIAVYQRALFDGVDPDTPSKLAPLLRQAIADEKVSGEYLSGHWFDVGTPERLAEVDSFAQQHAR